MGNGEKKERERENGKGRNCTESFGPSSKLLESRGHSQSGDQDDPEPHRPGGLECRMATKYKRW
jgi:hypothetical protein